MCLFACASARASEVEFAYEAGAEVVSASLWRGMYNAGLSFQPEATVGFDHEHIQFSVGAWARLGASDWGFRKNELETEYFNYNTYFVPEVDIIASVRSHGVTVGFTHYYYCEGPFFNFGDIHDIEGSSQTEVSIGLDLDDWLNEAHHAYVNWYTVVSGADANFEYDALTGLIPINVQRAYSSYLELGYDYTYSPWAMTIGAQLGIVPWRSESFYNTEGAALKCIALKLNKAWDMDVCEIDLFAQGMIDTDGINQDNAHINASGDNKLGNQKLNAAIGVGVWF